MIRQQLERGSDKKEGQPERGGGQPERGGDEKPKKLARWGDRSTEDKWEDSENEREHTDKTDQELNQPKRGSDKEKKQPRRGSDKRQELPGRGSS